MTNEQSETKDWPGTSGGHCPECGDVKDGWNMEFRVAMIHPRFGVTWAAPPGQEVLVAMRCPSCGQRFKVSD
jgi:hypothetical protein